jgi:hypothetical protein
MTENLDSEQSRRLWEYRLHLETQLYNRFLHASREMVMRMTPEVKHAFGREPQISFTGIVASS